MRIGVLGGTGPAGQGVAVRLAALGHDVILGSRDRDRAEGIVADLASQWGDRVKTLEAGTNPQAADADVVVIATVADAAVHTARYLADKLDGKVVVSMANGLVKQGREFRAVLPDEGSIAEAIQAAAPGSKVVAALQHVPAAALGDLDYELESDVLVAGDDDAARTTVLDLIDSIPGLRAFDAGSLANAHGIEAVAAPLLTINLRHKGEATLRITGAGAAAMTIQIYDTAQLEIVPFEVGPIVRMYVCGITPYDATHVGHAATFLTYDLLIRRLEELGHDVRMVRNVTDVDDSILPKARELGVPFLELAEAELARFRADMDALALRPAIAEPLATESIDGMIEMVAKLMEAGHAYEAHGTTYFDVTSFPRYGDLSRYSRDEMIRIARERGGNPDDPHRRDPLDFVLWQPSLPDEPSWVAPFGSGRPGWHVECSVMSMNELHTTTLDLHGGGTDLIFPHHECEIAQSESCTHEPFSRYWVHSAMVRYEGEKMSKSLGNLVFVSDLLKVADARAIRLALMRHHYRSGFDWHDTDLEEGTALLHRLLAAAECADGADPRPFAEQVRAAIDDDLDTPKALEALDDLASAVLSGGTDRSAPATLRELGSLLGIDLSRPLEFGKGA